MEDTWKIMRTCRSQIDKDSDISCSICNYVLVNAYFGPCGCRYCFDCIKEYLDDKEKLCPGKKDECKEEIINIKTNLVPGHWINKQILKTKVKCPEKNCNFEDELRNMEAHMRVCDFRPVECPYANVGCKLNATKTQMKTHLLDDIFFHSKLNLDSMDNLRHEMELLKKDVTVLTIENGDMKEELIALRNDVDNLRREKLNLEERMGKRVNSESLNKKVNYNKNNNEKCDQQEVEKFQDEVEEFQDEVDRFENETDVEILASIIEEISKTVADLKSQVDLNETIMLGMGERIKNESNEMKKEIEIITKNDVKNKEVIEEVVGMGSSSEEEEGNTFEETVEIPENYFYRSPSVRRNRKRQKKQNRKKSKMAKYLWS